MVSLIPTDELPPGFSYPAEYLRVVAFGLTNLEPWTLMDGGALRTLHKQLRHRRPGANLVPFAANRDTNEVACWDTAAGDVVVIDRGSGDRDSDDRDCGARDCDARDCDARAVAETAPNRTPDVRFEDFHGWLREAVENLTRFDG
jgi:hypothetical protein